MSFSSVQKRLARQIKDPSLESSEFEQRRLAIYQDLFFNNVEGFCANSFPVLKSVMAESTWLALVRQFFIEHPCETPHFIEISEEFLSYLAEHQASLPYPWMLELAHYEWIELAVTVADDVESAAEFSFNTTAEPLEDELIGRSITIPEYCFALAYNHPVHTISSSNYLEIEPQATHLLVYRDNDYQVKFVQTDALTVHWFSQLQQQSSFSVEDVISLLTSDQVQMPLAQSKLYLSQALPDLLKRRCLIVN